MTVADELAKRVFSGDPMATARACRWADDRPEGYRELFSALYARSSRARVIGLTGSPGVGKSTLASALVEGLRARGERVGVVAVDPVSPFTGGAVLGDRIRMQRHATDADVFVRSVSTRGALGGLSRSTEDIVIALSAWGAATILLETVGVGQDEIDVFYAADTTLVLLAPGFGDGVQALKAGLLEIADVFVANKADRDGIEALVHELESVLALGPARPVAPPALSASHAVSRLRTEPAGDRFVPSIVRTVASRGEGLAELFQAIERHERYLATEVGQASATRRARLRKKGQLLRLIHDSVDEQLGARVDEALARIESGTSEPYSASAELVASLFPKPGA
jgi:LAO/AO transport system kinase